MPIRIGLHPPAVPRLHADWSASQRSATALIKSVQLTAERLVRTPFSWALKVVGDFRRRFSLRNRLRRRQSALLRAFDDRYEQFVDLICWAAQSSSVSPREAYFSELRRWMRENYSHLRSQLQVSWSEPRSSRHHDPFESLLSFERLEDVLTAESSIGDMMLCRKALDEYQRRFGSGHCFG